VNVYGFVNNMPTIVCDYLGLACCGMEIGAKLEDVVEKARKHLKSNHKDRRWVCFQSRLNLGSGYDIAELTWHRDRFTCLDRGCGVGVCQDTVSVHGECYQQWDVNYVLWGMLADVCFGNLELSEIIVHLYRGFQGLMNPDERVPKDGRLTWTVMGFHGSYNWEDLYPDYRNPIAEFTEIGVNFGMGEYEYRILRHNNANRTSECPPCGMSYAGQLTVKFLGFHSSGYEWFFNPRKFEFHSF